MPHAIYWLPSCHEVLAFWKAFATKRKTYEILFRTSQDRFQSFILHIQPLRFLATCFLRTWSLQFAPIRWADSYGYRIVCPFSAWIFFTKPRHHKASQSHAVPGVFAPSWFLPVPGVQLHSPAIQERNRRKWSIRCPFLRTREEYMFRLRCVLQYSKIH